MRHATISYVVSALSASNARLRSRVISSMSILYISLFAWFLILPKLYSILQSAYLNAYNVSLSFMLILLVYTEIIQSPICMISGHSSWEKRTTYTRGICSDFTDSHPIGKDQSMLVSMIIELDLLLLIVAQM